MKEYISPFDYAHVILNAVKKGVLLTTKSGDEVNTMSISWGTMGVEWRKPVFITFVRGCRHTAKLLDASGEFTVNIPLDAIDPQIIAFCGTKSGRDLDKFQALGLTQEQPDVISAPGIRELPLTLECKVIYKQQQLPECMPDSDVRSHYPEDCSNIHDDFHTAYYGEIVSAYIIR